MASFFDTIINVFSGAHTGKSVGIDIGTSSIKIVEIEKIEEIATLKNYGELSLGTRAGVASGQGTNLSPEALGAALRDLIRETGITPRHALITIPASASLLSIVELPDVEKSELEGMIENEARKYIPIPITEVTLDWWVLPHQKTEPQETLGRPPETPAALGKIDVVIAAIHNDVLKKYETIKQVAGITPRASHVEIETFSTLRAIVGKDLTATLVVDMGASLTKLVIIDKGAMRGSHVISAGGQDVTLALAKSINVSPDEAESIKCTIGMEGEERGRDVRAVAELFLASLLNETLRFKENFEQKYKSRIEKIVFVGGSSRLKGFAPIAKEKFPGVEVSIGDPLARVDAPEFLKSTLHEISPNFAGAIGIALKGLEE